MKKDEVLEILINFNSWRRGEIDDIRYTPTEIGKAIDQAVKIIKQSK